MQSFYYMAPKKGAQERVIDFLLRRFPYNDEATWAAAIERGAIMVDGKAVKPGFILKSRMQVSYDRPQEDEPEVDREIGIIWEDETLLVVDKNGNLPIAESGKFHRNTLLHILKSEHGFEELYPVHRLDRETSGLLVLSKNLEVTQKMGEQFLQGLPQKTYHAILQGEMTYNERMIEGAMGKVKPYPGCVRIRQVVREDGKTAKTWFRRLQAAQGASLVEIKTFTGRTHQIRCHADYMGYPIIGDKLYGQPDERFVRFIKGDEAPLFPPFGEIPRQLLHASGLSFMHPLSGEELCFESSCYPVFGKFGFKELLEA